MLLNFCQEHVDMVAAMLLPVFENCFTLIKEQQSIMYLCFPADSACNLNHKWIHTIFLMHECSCLPWCLCKPNFTQCGGYVRRLCAVTQAVLRCNEAVLTNKCGALHAQCLFISHRQLGTSPGIMLVRGPQTQNKCRGLREKLATQTCM